MINCKDHILNVDGVQFTLDYPIQEAFEYDDSIVVLFRPESKKTGQFQNLIALSRVGRIKWTADLPTSETVEAYYSVEPGTPLIAGSFCGYRCEIDPRTGRILCKTFRG